MVKIKRKNGEIYYGKLYKGAKGGKFVLFKKPGQVGYKLYVKKHGNLYIPK